MDKNELMQENKCNLILMINHKYFGSIKFI